MGEGEMNDVDRQFWEAVYRALCAICKAIKKYKIDTVHIRFTEEETIWKSGELKPDPDQKSPFVKLR